jgi:DNA-binding PadR family transcriptional regulator
MYELYILSLLMRGPMHGYLIAKIIGDIIGPFARISHGSFYPLLARLEAEGLIAAAEDAPRQPPGGRRQRIYRITEEGRRRFRQLMLDTASGLGEYQKLFWAKMLSVDLLAAEERRQLLDHYLAYCQAHISYLDRELGTLAEQAAPTVSDAANVAMAAQAAEIIRHHRSQWQLELDLVRQWRERVVTPVAVARVSEGEGDTEPGQGLSEAGPA